MHDLIPIFLISLPRSGSTLLQRMLTVNPDIHSVSEPWFVLPLAYMCREQGILTTYSQKYAFTAIHDFIDTLPNGKKDLYVASKEFIISLYIRTKPKQSARYFLDKTPRYYLIINFLAEVFPDAKFIFLFRNPLEVLSSILTTWFENRFFIYRHYVDLYYGPQAMSKGLDLLINKSVFTNYSDLINFPEKELQKICLYLQISFDPSMLIDYQNILFRGRMGDKKTLNEHSSISTIPSAKWKSSLNTLYRKYFAKKYIKTLGNDTLNAFGTSVEELNREINTITDLRRGSLQDFFYHTISLTKILIHIDYYKKVSHSFLHKKRFFPLT